MTKNRESRWTRVYLSHEDQKPIFYVRLTPTFIDLEKFTFPHGISLGGQTFETKEQANEYADRVDQLMEEVAIELISELNKNNKE